MSNPTTAELSALEADAWRKATSFERAVEAIPPANRTYQLIRVHQTIVEMRSQEATRIHRLLEDYPPEEPKRAAPGDANEES
jgi:hypothetical protein